MAGFRLTKLRSLSCIGATVLLHWLILQPILLGSHMTMRPPPEQGGPGASAASSDDADFMTLVMVNMASVSESPAAEDFVSAGTAPSDLLIQVASADPAPLLQPEQFEQEDISEEAAQTAGNPAIQSVMFGRYVEQVVARIQRAWRKPRGAIAPSTQDAAGRIHQKRVFECQVRITQDRDGNVTEVELMQCDGSSEWQNSLVSAIQRASPLPSPPTPSVFANVLTLSFQGTAFVPGYREDEYEPAIKKLAQAGFSRQRSESSEQDRSSIELQHE